MVADGVTKSAGAYLLSKITVLGLITGIQAALLVLIGVSGVPLPRHGAYLPSPLHEPAMHLERQT